MSAQNHTLQLTSATPDAHRRVMLYRVTCSCGWEVAQPVAALTGRALHAQHLQSVLGPDRENVYRAPDARKETS